MVIDEQKANKLNNIYTSIAPVEAKKKSVEETCFTTYTGERTEKIKFEKIELLKKPLYKFLIQRPDEHFCAYKCPNCGFYHIGKDIE